MDIQWDKWQRDFQKIAVIGENPKGGINRLAYNADDEKAYRCLAEMGEKLGLEVRWDGAGNLWLIKKATVSSEAEPLIFGSHLDTVPNGGRYDGTLGVMSAFHALRLIQENKVEHQRDLILLVFRGEESSRFNCSTIGSKLLAGSLDISRLCNYADNDGITPYDAISGLGYRLENFAEAREYIKKSFAFIELHIEQGPVLESQKIDIGIVDYIAAPTRLKLTVLGTAAHSGTCPMSMRHDALAGAAEMITAIEKISVQAAEDSVVATVGKCTVVHQAINVVPGQVEFYLDLRGIEESKISEVRAKIMAKLECITERRGLELLVEILAEEKPVRLAEELLPLLEQQCRKQGLSCLQMHSGAGHDTMHMAKLSKGVLLFIPCEKGISHNLLEMVKAKDVENGIKLLYGLMHDWGNSTTLQLLNYDKN